MIWPVPAAAGPFQRDQGHFYVGVSYYRIATDSLYAPDFQVVPILPYDQQVASLYGEVGLITRWLTATVDGTLYRRNHIQGQGYTQGMGDWRFGLWTGLLTHPVHLSFGVIVGAPTGDPHPSAGPGADPNAQLIANSLPTGDGEWDVEGCLSLGASFGGVPGWPLLHSLIVETGYFLHTGYADAFAYRVQLGMKLPWRFIDRFWFSIHLSALQSFASQEEAARDATGLGPGVSYTVLGGEVFGRIWHGLGASLGADTARQGRSVAAGTQIKAGLSYEW